MKRSSTIRTSAAIIVALGLGTLLPVGAGAYEAEAGGYAEGTGVQGEVEIAAPGETAAVPDTAEAAAPTACQGATVSLVNKAETLNDRIKPIKTLVGYVRSPQGLAIKLVNDHVMPIPSWVGFAMDPVGTIKHRAIDEVRTRARNAILGDEVACLQSVPVESTWEV